ncbi:MAG TPA: response regulator, partial [Pyrinomonadaceae bacterium]|nr:response regulator [Pyrinomonadaceae bacterium]
LVKIVGDLLVSRSVFEQRLNEFNRQIEELHNSTNRLQQATGKLEVDFGTNQFHVPNSRFPARNFSFDSKRIGANDFDSLEFDQYNEFHETTRELVETTADTSAISGDLDTLKDNLDLLFEGQRRSIEAMQEKLLRLRMVRFGTLSARLQRTVRVTCEEEAKHADLSIEGETLEFDTQILDALVEPLLHLLRNAVAHGIEPPETRRLLGKNETGKIVLKIYTDGTHVNMIVSDDGRGVSSASLIKKAIENNLISAEKAEKLTEEEAFELMFLPGLTTAEKLSQVSGRGVGMNIVKTNISRSQGTISVKSKPQKGTAFTIRLPMSLAVTRAILVKSDNQVFAFPLKIVKQVTEISVEELELAKAENLLITNGSDFFPANLCDLLNLNFAVKPDAQIPLLTIETEDVRFGLAVEEIIKTEEIIIKPLGFPFQTNAGFLGATILGDGRVVPVLDLIFLLKNQEETKRRSDEATERQSDEEPIEQISQPLSLSVSQPLSLSVLIVDDSPSMRHVTTKLIKNAGWKPMVAKDGVEALEMLQEADELPNIILTDVEMPRMNGYELLAALKQNETLQKIPVVMITSRTGDKHRQKAFELGVSEYLTKPYEDSVLIETIKSNTE